MDPPRAAAGRQVIWGVSTEESPTTRQILEQLPVSEAGLVLDAGKLSQVQLPDRPRLLPDGGAIEKTGAADRRDRGAIEKVLPKRGAINLPAGKLRRRHNSTHSTSPTATYAPSPTHESPWASCPLVPLPQAPTS